jgi:electron transport complex protein RnfA
MFIKKTFPELYKTLGIFLPLITTNCAILFVALIQAMRSYGFITSIAFGFGAGVGFTLAIVIMAGIREQLEVADIPRPFRGAAITLIVAGVLALAFMGFTGLVSA